MGLRVDFDRNPLVLGQVFSRLVAKLVHVDVAVLVAGEHVLLGKIGILQFLEDAHVRILAAGVRLSEQGHERMLARTGTHIHVLGVTYEDGVVCASFDLGEGFSAPRVHVLIQDQPAGTRDGWEGFGVMPQLTALVAAPDQHFS